MPQYKIGTHINLQKAKAKQARNQKIINFIYTVMFGSLAAYGLFDLILRSHGI